MAIATRWIHRIDGVDLNDGLAFACRVPEAANDFGATVLLSDMAGRTPVYNRAQPVSGRFTFLIQILWDTEAQYLARLATLRALTAPGPHTYARAIPGQADTGQAVAIHFEAGFVVDDTDIGLATARAIAPDPTWA